MPKIPRIHTDVTEMEWHFPGVPRLGTVIMSPTALAQLSEAGVGYQELSEVLAKGSYVRHRSEPSAGLEHAGIRLVFRTSPLEGSAAVCVNGYRVT